jgi:hypothetical protein
MSRPSLDWSDPIAVSTWLAGLRLAFNDADAVAIDMLRPPLERELGPVLHTKNYEDRATRSSRRSRSPRPPSPSLERTAAEPAGSTERDRHPAAPRPSTPWR